jgi:4-hydroxy-2-oxoglutarate aldolase
MQFAGVFAPIPTPFDDDERVDVDRLKAALVRWLGAPLTGFVILGSTGEAAFIDEQESDQIVEVSRALVPADRPFIVGTGRESTRATIAASKRAAMLGADAALVRTPGFFKSQMTMDALVRHYMLVADASPIPILLYNFTAVTGVNLLPAAVGRLSRHPNIIGVKESGGDISQIADLVSGTPPDFTVLAGSAATFFPALSVGATGGILALSCVLPDACVRLFQLTSQHRFDEARELQRQLIPVSRLVTSTYGVAGLKAALRVIGYDLGVPRSPLTPVPQSGMAALQQALAQFEKASV